LPRSRDFYEEAIAVDPAFAPAHSGLAIALVPLVLPGITPARVALPLARAAAIRALEIDSSSQEAHAMLGMVAALYDFDWNEAGRHFSPAMAREPVSPYVRWYYSFSYLLPMGRTEESVQQCMRGLQDDPLNFIGWFHYGAGLLAGSNAEDGEARLRQLSESHPHLHQPYYLLALSQAVRKLHKEALASAEQAYSLAPWSTTTKGLLAGILRCTGTENRGDELHNEISNGHQHGSAMGLTLFHVGSGDIEHAAYWAAKATDERDTRMILLIALLRAFQPNVFCSNSKWSAIARTMGIPSEVVED
jgi:tetratricopeptide (TPR) repeat protein